MTYDTRDDECVLCGMYIEPHVRICRFCTTTIEALKRHKKINAGRSCTIEITDTRMALLDDDGSRTYVQIKNS